MGGMRRGWGGELPEQSKRWHRLLIAIGLAWMGFLWVVLYALLMKFGPEAGRLASEGAFPAVGIIATATPNARWGMLIGAGVAEGVVAFAALRSRRPAFRLVISAAGVHVVLTAFGAIEARSIISGVMTSIRAIKSAAPRTRAKEPRHGVQSYPRPYDVARGEVVCTASVACRCRPSRWPSITPRTLSRPSQTEGGSGAGSTGRQLRTVAVTMCAWLSRQWLCHRFIASLG